MGVYINMEMPTSCEECPLGDNLHCQVLPSVPALWAEYTNAIREKRLHSECPLIPVPPHGRLGDLDELYERAKLRSERFNGCFNDLDNVINALYIETFPTIIPPSEEGE